MYIVYRANYQSIIKLFCHAFILYGHQYAMVERVNGIIQRSAISVYKGIRHIDLSDLVEALSNIGLIEVLKKYYNKPLEHEARSIVAGPSFIQYLNKLFCLNL
jgi:hypothetical protein